MSSSSARVERGRPLGERPLARQLPEHAREPLDELGQPTDAHGVARLDRRGQGGAQPRVARHRDAEQQPIEPRRPGVLPERLQLERPPVRGVEAPAHTGADGELAQPVEVAVVEAEPPAHGRGGEQVEHLRGGEPRGGQLQEPGDDVEQRVDLPQRPVGQAHGQRLRRVRAGPERGGDERRERLDVRAHDQYVTRLEAGIGLQQAEHDLPQHLDLAVRPVAGVNLHGAVSVGHDEQPVVAQPPLQPAQQRGRRLGAGVVLVDEAGHGRGEPHLQLAHVAPERGQQRVRGRVGARVGGARRHRARCRVRSNRGPERGRGVGEPQVDGPVLAQRGEHGELLRGEAGGAEERQPLGQPDDRGIGAQGRARRVDPLGGIGAADAGAQPPPQLGLPRQIRVDPALARPPGPQQLGPVGGVGAEQLRHPAGQGVPAGVVGVEHGAPRLLRGRVEHLQQRPHRPLRVPRVGVGCAADRPADRLGDQRGGERNATPAQMPSPSGAPSRCERRCANHRSTPFAGTATTSAAKGSAGGRASTSARASASTSARSARCTWTPAVVMASR